VSAGYRSRSAELGLALRRAKRIPRPRLLNLTAVRQLEKAMLSCLDPRNHTRASE
jgi:hypothetical protein